MSQEPANRSAGVSTTTWEGDVVAVTPEVHVGVAVWMLVPVLVGVIAMAVATSLSDTQWEMWTVGAVAFACVLMVVAMVWTSVRRKRLRRYLSEREQVPAETYGELAWRLWHRTRVDRAFAPRFDAGQWIDCTGADGPRVITLDAPLPRQPVSDDVVEEVPIGADRKLGRSERRVLVLQLVVFGLAGATMLPALLFGASRMPWYGFVGLASPALFGRSPSIGWGFVR